MKSLPADKSRVSLVAAGAAIGLAGGLAEVLVVGAYSRIAGVDAAAVAGAVATAVHLDPGSAIAGLCVHMALSAALGVALLAAARSGGLLRDRSSARTFGAALLALGAIWGMNFFVVLPIVSPGFVAMLPYAVTLASKLMFAVAAVVTLRSIPANGASRWVLPRGLPRAPA